MYEAEKFIVYVITAVSFGAVLIGCLIVGGFIWWVKSRWQ